MKVVAVIPAYNEASRLGGVLESLRPLVDKIVVVDDGSTDATSEVARSHGAMLLRHVINRGQGAALRTGTLAALRLQPEVVVHWDADGQHDPAALDALLAPLARAEADVVYGSRFLGLRAEGMPWSRRTVLCLGRVFSQYALGIPYGVSDPQSGLRALRAQVAQELVFYQDGMAHCSEMLRWVTRSAWRWQEVPVTVHYSDDSLRKGQKAHHAVKIVWELLLGSF